MALLFLNNLQDLAEIQKVSFLKFILYYVKKSLKIFIKKDPKLKPYPKFNIILNLNNIKLLCPKVSYAFFKNRKITYSFVIKVLISFFKSKLFQKKYSYVERQILYGQIPLLTSDGTFLINGCERIVVSQIIKKPGVIFKKMLGLSNQFIYIANVINFNRYQTSIFLDEINIKQDFEYKWEDIFYISKDNNNLKFEYFDDKPDLLFYSSQKKINFRQFIFLNKFTNESFTKEQIEEKFVKIFNIFNIFQKKNHSYKKHYLVQVILDKRTSIYLKSEKSAKKRKKEMKKYFKNVKKKEISENFILITEIYPNLDAICYSNQINPFRNLVISQMIDKSQILKLCNFRTNFQILNFKNLQFNKDSYSILSLSNQYFYNTSTQNSRIEKEILTKDKIHIGALGRDSFNKRFGFNKLKYNFSTFKFNLSNDYLTKKDFIDIFNKLYSIKYNYDDIDNRDDLDYKQIRSCGEFLKINLENFFKENYLKCKGFNDLCLKQGDTIYLGEIDINLANITISSIYDFFIGTEISQYADQINPLSTLAHKRKLSLFGPEGLQREKIGLKLRNINPTQFNKICFIETSEGRNAGVVTTLALNARISENLGLETPYIFLNCNKRYLSSNLIFLDAAFEKIKLIGFESYFKNLKKKKLTKKGLDFLNINSKYLEYLTLSPIQTLSLGISIIPFIEHNDGNRALMGSNMQRQAVPLLNCNRSIVGIERDYNIASDSKFVIRSYSEGIIKYHDNSLIMLVDIKNQFLRYSLPKKFITNQYLSLLFKPILWINEKVFNGEIIATSSNIVENELALGSNLTIAYMTWEGYNFEDAIVINETLITNNILTSLHINIHEIIVSPLQIYDLYKSSFNKSIFDYSGILKIGSYVYPGDPIILTKLANIFTNDNFIKKNYKKVGRITSDFKFEGRLVKIVSRFLNQDKTLIKLRLFIAKYTQIEIGDKLSGRHGNKGIISRILPNNEMPYLPNGDVIDLIVNPLGVPSRMNVGQLFECLLGISGEKLGIRYKIFPFDETISKNSSRILVNAFMYKTMYKLKRSWFYNINSPGKILLKDGRTGEYYDNAIIVGKSYILKLIHLVEDKIHSRALGPYNSITEQPLEGSANAGGQRFGEMEVWALEAYGSSFTLQELLTIKSDNLDLREEIYLAIKKRNLKMLPIPVLPEIFILLVNELKALILNTSFNTSQKSLYLNMNNKLNLFKYLEDQLKIKKKL
jgi:DNA-directed RNA polymerase subunit beta